ncbi:MAG: hypothetical protein QF685_12735 [Verrucomicrobiota bacterium]|jgi:hypothetical protein|nr:hypothetical protein [Verrucomicrobiota bacterium]
MSQWKVILATLLIFGSGIGTGVLLSERNAPGKEPQLNGDRHSLRPIFFRSPGFLVQHLDLTEQQKEQIHSIMEDSHENIRNLSIPFRDQLKQEQQSIQKKLRKTLTPEQAKKFDLLPPYRFPNEKAGPSGRPARRRSGGSLPPPEQNESHKPARKPEKSIKEQPSPGKDGKREEALPDLKTV